VLVPERGLFNDAFPMRRPTLVQEQEKGHFRVELVKGNFLQHPKTAVIPKDDGIKNYLRDFFLTITV
jgi:hypothetical protein